MLDRVAVVDVEERAPHDGFAEIEAEAAVAEQLDVEGQKLSALVEAHPEAPQKGVAFAGDGHVAAAVEPYAHRPSRLLHAQRGDAGKRRRLHFLAAECASHAQRLTYDAVRRNAEHARDDGLRFARMLRRRVHQQFARLVVMGVGGLGFEIEVLLATDEKLALYVVGCARQRGAGLPSLDTNRLGEKQLTREGGFEISHGGQRFDVHVDHSCGPAGNVFCLGEHPGYGLTHEHDLFREREARHGARDRCR